MDYFNRQKSIISSENQAKLKKTTVLVVGIGGLGTPVCQQLVRLGVGTLHLIDNGIIEATDLNRQFLYTTADIGSSKVDIARNNLLKIGLGTEIYVHNIKIGKDFTFDKEVDIVIDCLDNFQSRYYLDDYVQIKNIPMIYGGIYGMYGQITTIIPKRTKSLRDLFDNVIPNIIDKIPVIAPIPSLVASIQVVEFVKFICGFDNTLVNRMYKIDLNEYITEIFDIA
jgi:molybdopterin/thiamine biosynthesis adenylyltransferase